MGILYIFEGLGHTVKFLVSEDKTMRIATEKTDMKWARVDKYVSRDQNIRLRLKVKGMSDEDFEQYLISEFTSGQWKGYKLKEKKQYDG